MILGDNIIENNICQAVENFRKQGEGAKILLKEVTDAQRFGVAEIRGNHVIGIEEKPKGPRNPIMPSSEFICTTRRYLKKFAA